MMTNRQDKFGFYEVGSFRSYSKFDAVTVAEKTNQPLRWNFNDSVYRYVNWEIEPVEPLAELYRRRAQQIRDQYDYLVLWYSSGADSANILDVFLKNNIKLDDAATYVNYDATGNKFNFLNGEIFNVAIPTLEKAREQQPWLRHTMIDLSQMTMDHFNQKEAKFDWVYHMNKYVNPNCLGRQDVKLRVKHWRDLIDQGKRVGFIHGIDKPRVYDINGRYYFKFLDMVDNAVTAYNQIADRPWEFDELFYWSPDLPEIPIKQAHIIKQFFKSATAGTHGLTKEVFGGVCSTVINNRIHWITPDKLHSLIYPYWYPVPFQNKAPSWFFTPRDEWFFKLPDSDPAKYSWKVGLQHRWKITPDSFKVDPKNMYKGLKDHFTTYYLGT